MQTKITEIERATTETEAYEALILQLTTIHHSDCETIDWAEICASPKPSEPQKLKIWEPEATKERDAFRPTLWQRISGKQSELIAQLDRRIAEARERDEVSYRGALKLHQQRLEQWQQTKALASGLVANDLGAYQSAVEELNPLGELQEMGCEIEMVFTDSQTVRVTLKVESEKVVPKESKSLLRSGKLSVKPITKSRFYELYQDYVCGCVLRTAREMFALLPLTRVIVDVNASLLDTATGHLREQTILSVGMPRLTIENLNCEAADPSDAMRLFPHRMGFKRSEGFSPVTALTKDEFPS